MLKYIYQSLMFFRKAFSRNFTWLIIHILNQHLFNDNIWIEFIIFDLYLFTEYRECNIY